MIWWWFLLCYFAFSAVMADVCSEIERKEYPNSRILRLEWVVFLFFWPFYWVGNYLKKPVKRFEKKEDDK